MAEWVDTDADGGRCELADCDETAAIRLDVPWEGTRHVCAAHGRAWAQREGVVAMPLEDAREAWTEGQAADPKDANDE